MKSYIVPVLIVLAFVLLTTPVFLGGCHGIPVAVEVCIVDPEYGKICASYVKGQPVTIKADVSLPPEARSRIEAAVRRLAGD